jgi:uncharacterized protein with HEPN domain
VNKDIAYLKHAEDAAAKIQSYMPETLQAFEANEPMQHAIMRLYTILGQAIKNLSAEFREQNGAVLWKDFTGFRDVIVHQYFSIDLNIVWRVTQEELPSVHRELLRLIAVHSPEQP